VDQLSSQPTPEKLDDASAKKLKLILPLAVAGLVVLMIVLFIFVLNNSKNQNSSTQTTPEAQTITPTLAPSPTPISTAKIIFPTPAPLKEYVSTEDGIMFSYPGNWNLAITKTHPGIHPNDEYEDFILSLKPNNYSNLPLTLKLNLTFSAWGVGGGCPGYDPEKDNAETKKVNVLGTDIYLVDGSYSGQKTIYAEYATDNPQYCPNIAFSHINGIPGLFAASIAYFDNNGNQVLQGKDNFINRPEILTAEQIIQSISFIK